MQPSQKSQQWSQSPVIAIILILFSLPIEDVLYASPGEGEQLSNDVVTKPSSKSLGVSFVSLLEEVSRYTESASVDESCKWKCKKEVCNIGTFCLQ